MWISPYCKSSLWKTIAIFLGIRAAFPRWRAKHGCSHEVIRNGLERGEENCWTGREGDVIEYRFEGDTLVHEVRLVFDSDLNRDYHNMPCCYPLHETRYQLPKTLIRSYRIEGEAENGQQFCLEVGENHQRLARHRAELAGEAHSAGAAYDKRRGGVSAV